MILTSRARNISALKNDTIATIITQGLGQERTVGKGFASLTAGWQTNNTALHGSVVWNVEEKLVCQSRCSGWHKDETCMSV